MAITDIKRDFGIGVNIVRIVTTNTLAEASAANYILNQADNITAINNGAFEWVVSDMTLVYASDGWMFASISSDFNSLTPLVFSTTFVGAPAVVGNFATFASVSGNIEDLGYLPSDATKTNVVMAGSAVVVNHIAKFVDVNGTIDDTAGDAINSGNIIAGLSGTPGYLASFPTTAAKGSLRLVAADNVGNTVTQITNASFAQATALTIPDPASATANFVIAPAALVDGNLVKASGTAGLVADQGFAMKSVAGAAAAGGAAAQSFTDAFCTAGSVVIGNWVTQTNPGEVVTIVPGAGSFVVTSTADIGAGTFSYIITK
jgi:hypothetical protein